MDITRYVPDRLRSRYALKLLGISVLIAAIVVGLGTVTALQVSERVTEKQLQTAEANAELEANELAGWFEGEQESIRVLSAHRGIDAADHDMTRETLESELSVRSAELADLHLAEREDGPEGVEQAGISVSTDRGLEGVKLADTAIDWGEDTDGNPITYEFSGQEDLLISWVYLDGTDMTVAIASPTPDGEHVLIGEYHPSVRVAETTDVVTGTNTVVLGGVSAYVMFDSDGSDEFRPYKGEGNRGETEVGSRILEREDQFAPLSGSEIDDYEVRGYHSVPSEGVNWVVVKETPRENARALTDQVRSDLTWLILTVLFGFLLIGAVIQYGPIRSIQRLSRQADALANGDLSVEIKQGNRIDEVGQLRGSFTNIKRYITAIASKSEALARQEFDSPVLDEDIPGTVGESMEQMRADLEGAITKLEAERERYSTLVTQSNDGVVVVRNEECIFTNRRFLDITGYDESEILGVSFAALFALEDRDEARRCVSVPSGIGGKEPSITAENRRLTLENRAGEHRTIELSASRIEHEQEPAVLVNVRDITEQRRREQRLEIFNRVLRHNLRNDLQVVQSALKSANTDDEETAWTIDVAEGKVADLLETAHTARRIERAFDSVEIREYDLEAVLGPLVERARETYPDATIEMRSEPATVEAATVLEEALWELLDNAVRHSGENPHVSLEIERKDDLAILRISDDGPGLPKNERQTIENEEETELKHANGLGLWLAHWTVEASGGALSFTVDDGTTVAVSLPLSSTDRTDQSLLIE